MKKKLLIFLTYILLVGSVKLMSVSAYSEFQDNNNSVIQKFRGLDEAETKKMLKEYDNKQLLEEVNEVSKYFSQTDFTPIALEIIERADKYSYDELLEEIQDNENTDEFINLIIDTYMYKSNKSDKARTNNEDLKMLLTNNNIGVSAKVKIILDATDETDIDTITSFIQDSNDDIVCASLKKLSIIDSKAAKAEAEKIIKDRTRGSISERKLRAAQKAMVKELRKAKNKTDNLEFINTNMEIFEQTSSQELKDTSIFSLAEIRDIDAVRSILNNESIDFELKVYTIDFNFKVLEELLNQPEISDDDIDLIIRSMEIHPILDFKDKIADLKNKTTDMNIINRLDNVINNI